MPKLKTHKGASKRLKRTGTGRIKRNKAGRRHLLVNKSTKRLRKMRSDTAMVSKADARRYDQMLP